jgi:molybdopterin synthase catalytic subunit
MISVQSEDFDSGAEIENMCAGRSDLGAVVSFTGLVRGGPVDDPLLAMIVEHYPGMTEKALAEIEARARARWPLTEVLIVHRFGQLKPGERIVLVTVGAAHRQAAFEAASFLMDYLKTRAPFWKREIRASGVHWVEARAEDGANSARWNG